MLDATDFPGGASDRWRTPPPILGGTSTITVGATKVFAWDFDSPILCTDSTDGGLDAYFEETAIRARRHRPTAIAPARVSAAATSNFVGKTPRLFTFVGDAREEEFFHETNADRIEFVCPNLGGGVGTELFVFAPYTWHEIDLAELVVALTRYWSGAGAPALDELDEPSLLLYSERMLDPRFRQRFSLWRQVDETLSDTIRRVVDQSNAIVSFGVGAGAGGLSFRFRIFEFDDLEENSAIYDAADGRDSFIVQTPEVRIADDAVANRSKFKFGAGLRVRGLFNYPTYQSGRSSPVSPPEEENTIRQERPDSVDAIGLRAVSPPSRTLAQTEQWAEGSFEVGRWERLRKRISFSMGPLHFDFNPGDIIHLSEPSLGIDPATDFVVISKVFDWDTLLATIVVEEIDRDFALPIAPDEVESGAELVGWFKGDCTAGFGTTPPATDPLVILWPNEIVGGPAPDLTQLGRGTAFVPSVLRSYRNGLDALDFRKPALFSAAGLDWSWTSGEESWTFFVCGEFFPSAGPSKRILDSVGGSSGALGILSGVGGNDFAYFTDGGLSGGPPTLPPVAGVLVFQLFRTRANYVFAGDERTFVAWYPFPFDLSTVEVADDIQTRRDAFERLLGGDGSFGTDAGFYAGPGWRDVLLRGFAGNTSFGTNAAATGEPAELIAFEWLAFRHARGVRPLRSRELRGVLEYLRRWE